MKSFKEFNQIQEEFLLEETKIKMKTDKDHAAGSLYHKKRAEQIFGMLNTVKSPSIVRHLKQTLAKHMKASEFYSKAANFLKLKNQKEGMGWSRLAVRATQKLEEEEQINEGNDLISTAYKLLRMERDLKAVSKGPDAIVKRMVRKKLGRISGSIINKLVGK